MFLPVVHVEISLFSFILGCLFTSGEGNRTAVVTVIQIQFNSTNCLNRSIFSCFLKMSTEATAPNSCGRAFHDLGSKDSNALSPFSGWGGGHQ